ncbi:MAG: (Fe-S)-binding protein, partial [Planctomycetaceae bacterium]
YPRRLKWALAPMRWLQLLRVDSLVRWLGLDRLLPGTLGRMYRLLPRLAPVAARLPEVLPAEGKRRARVGLFTGCVGDVMFSGTNRATARVLQANGCEVVVPREEVCCGAIHYHSGAAAPALEMARRNVAAFPEDLDAVILNVAGCGSMLKDYGQLAAEGTLKDSAVCESLTGFSSRVRDISEFLVELGPRPPLGEVRWRATYHDACHLAHAQGIREAPRKLMEMVPGLELVTLPESDICCGAAGSYNLTEAEMSDRLAKRKVANILSTGADVVISGNAGCTLQLQAALRLQGRSLQVVHPADVLDLSYNPPKAAN